MKPAVAPAKATPAKAAPQAGSQPKAPAKAPAKAAPKAVTITAKSPIGKTIKARKAATVTLKAQNEAKNEEKKKLPPIIVDGQGLKKAVATKLRAEGVLFTQEPGFASTRLVAADLKSYEAAKKILVDLKVNFFTYAANPAATISRILKRIPTDYSAKEVQDEIQSATGITCDVGEMLGWTPRKEGEDRKKTRKLPMIRVTATPEQLKVIMEADLFNTKNKSLIWERPLRQPIIQCFKCQRFGHTSQNCHMPARCVKCAQQHADGACQNNDKTQKAYCVNCGIFGHPANFKQCPKYLLAVRRLEERQQRNGALEAARRGQKTQPGKAAAPSMLRDVNISYTQVLGNQVQRATAPQKPTPAPAAAPVVASVASTAPLAGANPVGPSTSPTSSTQGGEGRIPTDVVFAHAEVWFAEMDNMSPMQQDFHLLRSYRALSVQFAKKRIV